MPDRAEAAAWLAANRRRAVDAIARALGVDRGEVLRRLGTRLRDLEIVGQLTEQAPPRPRGRPRRSDIDRETVLEAMRGCAGRLHSVARTTQLPRSTIRRYAARLPKHAWMYGARISEAHGAVLAKSGVSTDVARVRGYVSVRDGLLVPLWNGRGVQMWSQTRLDQPKGSRHRYRNSRDAVPIVDVSPFGRQLVLDHDRPLYVTEGPRKADAAVSLGLACVAVAGVRMLCLDPKTWEYLGVDGRDVRVVFDSDVAWNVEVRTAEQTLVNLLESLGARVRVVRLPGAQKVGLDDFLGGGKTEADLVALLKDT